MEHMYVARILIDEKLYAISLSKLVENKNSFY